MHGVGVYTFASGKTNRVRYTAGNCDERAECTQEEANEILRSIQPRPAGAPATAAPAAAETPVATSSPTAAAAPAFPDWLKELPIDDEVRATFLKEKVDEEAFLLLDGDDLKELGVPLGARKLLLKEIAKRQQ